MITLIYNIDYPDESAAGLRGYTDTVKITVGSGDPGGAPGEFAQFMAEALQEWHDGAFVTEVRD